MSESVTMTFSRVQRSSALEQKIRALADKLRALHGPAIHCEVMIEPAESNRLPTPLCLRLRVLGARNAISLERTDLDTLGHRNAYVAVRELFDAAHRLLQQAARHDRRNASKIQPVIHVDAAIAC